MNTRLKTLPVLGGNEYANLQTMEVKNCPLLPYDELIKFKHYHPDMAIESDKLCFTSEPSTVVTKPSMPMTTYAHVCRRM